VRPGPAVAWLPVPFDTTPSHTRPSDTLGRQAGRRAVSRRPGRRRGAALLVVGALGLATGCTANETTSSRSPSPSRTPPSGFGAALKSENAKPGASDWQIRRVGAPNEIEGWADRDSVASGDSVGLHVSTTASQYRVTAYRMGWYGGAQARAVWTSPPQPGAMAPAKTTVAATNTDTAPWPTSMSVSTRNWLPGDYLLRLDADAGAQRYVPLTVRTSSTRDAIVILNATTTWQAYNDWGGHSLYHGPGGDADAAHRATVVSFDRPYPVGGAEEFTGNELPLVSLAERLDLPLAFATDVDLHADPQLLDGARAVISLGHDEYYSTPMRDALTAARDRGTNIAFLGANAVFRHIRLDATPVGPNRLEINYRSTVDPVTKENPREATVNWREPPNSRPESDLTGVLYECNPVKADMVVTNPGHWLFAGLGLRDGLPLPGLVGSEYDRVNPAAPLPRPIEVLAHSPVSCRHTPTFADMAYYTAPSGAAVFATGTSAWVCALAGSCQEQRGSPEATRVVAGVTTNLLHAFATGPAGREHPAKDNLDVVHEYAGDPIEDKQRAGRGAGP
jgi:hypothetical protein